MIFNVVLPNASLAYSSIQFYQVARVLLTPCVAVLNYTFYNRKISSKAALTLVPVCIGVGVVSYFDTMPKGEIEAQVTKPLGVIFAFSGVLASSLYTVWIKWYHEKLECSSMQLLMNQAPISVLMMLYIIPFSDDVTVWRTTTLQSYLLILIVSLSLMIPRNFVTNKISQSGLLACLINLSQFVIINEAGPVSSTVVGHFKTCSIVAMGWMISKKALTDGSMVGIVMAIGGIVA